MRHTLTLMTTEQVAPLLGIRPETLANWRGQGKGPRFKKLGAAAQSSVRYDPRDIDAYMRDPAKNSCGSPTPGEAGAA